MFKAANFFVVLLSFCQTSCMVNNENGKKTKTFEHQYFSFTAPKQIDIKLLDSNKYSATYLVNVNDTLHFNIGYYGVSNLSDTPPELVILRGLNEDELSQIIHNSKDENKVFSSDFNADIDRYKKQNVYFKKERDQLWKYTFPIDTNSNGILGLYIDSLFVKEDGNIRLNFYFNQLNSINFSDAKQIIYSLKTKDSIISKSNFYPTKVVN